MCILRMLSHSLLHTYAQVDLVPGCCFRSPAPSKVIATGERDCHLVGLDLVVLASMDYIYNAVALNLPMDTVLVHRVY